MGLTQPAEVQTKHLPPLPRSAYQGSHGTILNETKTTSNLNFMCPLLVLQEHPVFPILKTLLYFLSVLYQCSSLTSDISIFYERVEVIYCEIVFIAKDMLFILADSVV